jgi:hypothetical protein
MIVNRENGKRKGTRIKGYMHTKKKKEKKEKKFNGGETKEKKKKTKQTTICALFHSSNKFIPFFFI